MMPILLLLLLLLLISCFYLNIFVIDNWMSYIWVFLENNTFCTDFLGSGLNDIFQLYAHVKVASRSFVRSLALSYLFLATEKREVSSTNNLVLDFNPSGKSLIYIKKAKISKLILEELLQEQAASLSTEQLEELFETYWPKA